MADDHATVSAGGRPHTTSATSTPDESTSMESRLRAAPATVAAAVPTMRLASTPSSRTTASINQVCRVPANTSGAVAPAVTSRRTSARPRSPSHSPSDAVSAMTMTSAPTAASGSPMPDRRVSYPSMGPDCLMSSALPAATDSAASIRRTSRTRARRASVCATLAPMGPAPSMAIVDIHQRFYLSTERSLVPGSRAIHHEAP